MNHQDIIATAQAMHRTGLAPGTSGNVSARDGDTFVITPTGMAYDGLTAGDLVTLAVGGHGRVVTGTRAPSSEWRLHDEIYRVRPDVAAIVHTHSMFATAVACTRRDIPAFHYMVAMAGGHSIRCAPYATYGTDELAQATAHTLGACAACLMANHGLIAVGQTLAQALRMASTVEMLAEQYWRALQIGPVHMLDDDEMNRVLHKIGTYGRDNRG